MSIYVAACPFCFRAPTTHFRDGQKVGEDPELCRCLTPRCALLGKVFTIKEWNAPGHAAPASHPKAVETGLPEGCQEIIMFGPQKNMQGGVMRGQWLHKQSPECVELGCLPVDVMPAGSRERLRKLEGALEWRSMKTAPRNGKPFIGKHPSGVVVAFLGANVWEMITDELGNMEGGMLIGLEGWRPLNSGDPFNEREP